MIMLTCLLAAALLRPQSGNIELPFRVGDNAIIVDAVVNGHPVSCMFDTGFSGSFALNEDVDVGKVTGKMRLRDFVGEFEADTVDITSLKLGDKIIDPKDKQVVKQRNEDYSFGYGQHVDGIMGLEVMKGEILEINFEKKKFIFHSKGFDITKQPVDGTKTFMAKMLPMGRSALELAVKTEAGDSMTLALDTGNAFYITSHKDVLERVGIWKAGKVPIYIKESFVASGAVASWSLKMPKLFVYGVPVTDSIWDIIDLPSGSAESDGTVGFGFLHNFNIIFDTAKRRVWLENWTGKTHDAEMGHTGIYGVVEPESKRVRIFRVVSDSPAAKAGIARGDYLLGVDGVDILAQGYREIDRLMTGAPDSIVKVVYSHAGDLRRVDLKRQSLVNTP